MAYNKKGLMKAKAVGIFLADDDAEYPTFDKLSPASMEANPDWESFGYTSRETLPSITPEGGEVTTHGAAEEPDLIATAEDTKRTISFEAIQITAETLGVGYNGDYDEAAKTFAVKSQQSPIVKRMTAVITNHDGAYFGICARVAISAEKDLTPSLEGFSTFGLKCTVLSDNGTSLTFVNVHSDATPIGS